MPKPFALTLLFAAASLAPGCLCDPTPGPAAPAAAPDLSARELYEARRPNSLKPPPREPGPPREETERQVEQARKEAAGLMQSLSASGIDAREKASVADMRGYRLYRKRNLKQAQVWFERAVEVDPTFEPSLLNAARCAVLLGQPDQARAHLQTLKKLDTPLARSRLALTTTDPDFQPLHNIPK